MDANDHLDFPAGYQAHLTRVAAATAECTVGGLEGIRFRYDLMGEKLRTPYPPGMRVRDLVATFAGREIAIRLYWPADLGDQPPIVVYFHGGGLVSGHIASHDHITWALAHESRAVLASVQYRRPPENPYPAPQDDCYAALSWLVERAGLFGFDANRLSVAGDSAGALLSTAVAMIARDKRGPVIRHQALFYGVYDMDMDRASYRTAKDVTLTLPMMREFSNAYLPGEARAVAPPTAIPLHATVDQLRGLPPALFVDGSYDVLFEEEREYAALLRSAEVPVQEIIVSNVMHGFLRAWDVCPAVQSALRLAAAEIQLHLRPRATGA